jgi:hypothetical protein
MGRHGPPWALIQGFGALGQPHGFQICLRGIAEGAQRKNDKINNKINNKKIAQRS